MNWCKRLNSNQIVAPSTKFHYAGQTANRSPRMTRLSVRLSSSVCLCAYPFVCISLSTYYVCLNICLPLGPYVSVCVHVHLSGYLSVYTKFVCIFVCALIRLRDIPVCQYVFLPMSISQSMDTSFCLHICVSKFLSVRLHVSPYVRVYKCTYVWLQICLNFQVSPLITNRQRNLKLISIWIPDRVSPQGLVGRGTEPHFHPQQTKTGLGNL